MKKFKFILPVMAILCSVGLSFASVFSAMNTGLFVELQDGTPYELQTQVNCEVNEQLSNQCEVIIESLAPEEGPYQVYDDSSFSTPLKTNEVPPIVIPD
ncbi:DUF6520 family protein [Sinomicrobium kalidii]|uniref:DUF6520 family protein n=1 Tax=Sinomicrobium kalidii TaxID=2900738 RepID=UPI001E3ED14E|nr:DUF6520 family protein [Sinomicrobium kalidii]UGU15738.1 DUF6520 family protein [Sinomicrobium kalidii]